MMSWRLTLSQTRQSQETRTAAFPLLRRLRVNHNLRDARVSVLFPLLPHQLESVERSGE